MRKNVIDYMFFIVFILSLVGCNDAKKSSEEKVSTGKWILSDGPPLNTTGSDGDMYLNTNLSDIFVKKGEVWSFAGSLKGNTGSKGDKGETGEKGSLWATGTIEPDESILGRKGDFYINVATNQVYKRESNSWEKIFDFKGEKGEQGVPGRDGNEWKIGTMSPPPSNVTAKQGDLYLNTITGEVYQRGIGVWTGPIATVKSSKGADGKDGNTWIVGDGSPSVDKGVPGDLYLDGSKSEVYKKELSGWDGPLYSFRGSDGIDGAPGKDGTNGVDGKNGNTWCYSPEYVDDPNYQTVEDCNNKGRGNIGDFLVDGESGQVWKKEYSNQWVKAFQLAMKESFEALIKEVIDIFIPPGTVVFYAGPNCPIGYVTANGQEVLRNQDFIRLFEIFGTTYGEGNGSTTFNLPNANGRVLMGDGTYYDEVLGNTTRTVGQRIGTASHRLTIDEMPSHNHRFGYDGTDGWNGWMLDGNSDRGYNSSQSTYNTGGDKPHNIVQPSLVMKTCIKY